MNTTTLTADAAAAVPSIAPLEALHRPVRARREALVGAAAIAVLSAWAFDGGALGLGFFLVVSAFAIVLGASGGWEAWQSARAHRGLLAAASALSAFIALRDSGMLVALDLIAVIGLLALAVRGWNGDERAVDVSMRGLVAAPFRATTEGVKTGALAVAERLRDTDVLERAPGLIAPVAKMLLIGGPIVGLVTLLLASGDAAFGAQVGRLLTGAGTLPLPEAVRMGMVATWAFVFTVGLVTWALRRRSFSAASKAGPVAFQLGLPEAFAVLGGLTAVLGLFSVVSARCAFAPDSCSLPEGLTYSEYARRGFWELLTVAAIVLLTVLSVPHRAKATTPGARTAVKLGASVLVTATLPVLLSAVNRMMLYEAMYGFTRQRVLSQAICVFVGLLLVWRAVTVWAWPHRFAIGFVGSGVLVLLGFNAMNPDAFIARRNLEREWVDVTYLSELSADAAGVLREWATTKGAALKSDATMQAWQSERRVDESEWAASQNLMLPEYRRAFFSSYRTAPEAFSSFNLARACDDVVAPLASSLCP